MQPSSGDTSSQTENGGGVRHDSADDTYLGPRSRERISRIRATLVEPIARGKQDRLACNRRVALSRALSAFLVISTAASCILLQRSGLVDLALGRISVAVMGLVWFASTFTEVFVRDTRRVCDGISFLCFLFWSFSHIMWRLTSSEASQGSSGGSGGGKASPAWIWVDVGIAWAIAPAAGGSLQLSLWGSIVPSWLCVTLAVAYGLRAEEVAVDGEDVNGVLMLITLLAICGLAALAIGYQVLWEQARDAKALMALEDRMALEDHRQRETAFSELLLRHLVTEPSLQVLEAGVKELFRDSRMMVLHRDALEQIEDGVSLLSDYGAKALDRLKQGITELPSPVFENADMEGILDACLRTTAYLAVSRDRHKVQLDLKVAADVEKNVKTYRLWLSQMTRACLISALHPDEDDNVILRVSYAKPGLMRVGVEAVWRVPESNEGNKAGEGGASVEHEGPRMLSGWNRDMPPAAWWVRAAALSLGGEADYDRSKDREGFHELWFTIPASNTPEDELKRIEVATAHGEGDGASADAGAGVGGGSPAKGKGDNAESVMVPFDGNSDDSPDDRSDADSRGSLPPQQLLNESRGNGSLSAGPDTVRALWTGRQASQRQSMLDRASSTAPSPAGATAAGGLVGPDALPRPGGWAVSNVPTLQTSSHISSKTPDKRGSSIPALRTEVTAFNVDDITTGDNHSDIVASGRRDMGDADDPPSPTALGSGYRSSLSGTLVKIVGGKKFEKRQWSTSLKTDGDDPDIRINRVNSAEDSGRVSGRPPGESPFTRANFSSGGGGVSTPREGGNAHDYGFASDQRYRSLPGSPDGFPGPTSTRGGLAGGETLRPTVTKLLGTKNGLRNLQSFMHYNDSEDPEGELATARTTGNSRMEATMATSEAVSRSAGQEEKGVTGRNMSQTISSRRPLSAPSSGLSTKTASLIGGLVQSLTESNGINWLGSGRNITLGVGGSSVAGDSSGDSDAEPESKIEILVVDPQGMLRWVLPRLRGRDFSVTVAHSAEEAMVMIKVGFFQAAVVDLHMPKMVGIDFCRRVRRHELETANGTRAANAGVGGAGGEGSDEAHPSIKLLLHTTSAGTIETAELEDFLNEGIVEEYLPVPLAPSALFDFLKLFEEEDDQYWRRKSSNNVGDGKGARKRSALVRSLTETAYRRLSASGTALAAADRKAGGNSVSERKGRKRPLAQQHSPPPSGPIARFFRSGRAPTPTVDDVASSFFTVKGYDGCETRMYTTAPGGFSEGTAMRGGNPSWGGSTDKSAGKTNAIKVAGSWKPGAAAVSPGLGVLEDHNSRVGNSNHVGDAYSRPG